MTTDFVVFDRLTGEPVALEPSLWKALETVRDLNRPGYWAGRHGLRAATATETPEWFAGVMAEW